MSITHLHYCQGIIEVIPTAADRDVIIVFVFHQMLIIIKTLHHLRVAWDS